MLVDKDLLSCLKYKKACSSITIGASIHYIIRQIDIPLDRRHQDLSSKRPGTIISEQHPYVIWVRMLRRPKDITADTSTVFSLRGKFNSILEERLLLDGKDERSRIMSLDVRPDEFDRQGNLTSAGKVLFWKEIDSAIKKLDINKITLRPRPLQNQSSSSEQSKSPAKFVRKMLAEHKEQPPSKRFKLMTPPPPKSGEGRNRERHQKSPRRKHSSYNKKSSHHHSDSRLRSRSRRRSSHSRPSHNHHHHHHNYDRHHRGSERRRS